MTKDELKALAKAMPRNDEPTQPLMVPTVVAISEPKYVPPDCGHTIRTVYSVCQQGNGWVLTRHDVPVSVLEATEMKGSRVGPEILGIVLHRLEEMIMKADGIWRNGR